MKTKSPASVRTVPTNNLLSRPSLRRGSLLSIGVASLMAVGSTGSVFGQASYYWDADDGTNGLQAGGGTWNTSSSNKKWSDSLNATNSTKKDWNNGFNAIFQISGTSVVNVSTIFGIVEVNSIVFNGTGYTISGDPITLTGVGGNITVNTAATTATISSRIAGSNGLTKKGSANLTLSGQNTYTGNTTISEGTLTLTGSGSIAPGSAIISVASGATLNVSGVTAGPWTVQGTSSTRQILTGSGGVTGNTVIGSFGTHNAGSGGVGTQAFSNTLTYSSGSIFEWDLDVTGPTPSHDKVTTSSLLGSVGGGAQFKVVLAGNSYATPFWDSARTWTATEIFGTNANLTSIFSISSTAPSDQGSFSFTDVSGGTGNQLTWTPIPEPTSALAGLLLAAGLLRRKRCLPSA